MGIGAPFPEEKRLLILSAILSRPIYFLLTFVVSFLAIYFLTKKNFRLALTWSLIIILPVVIIYLIIIVFLSPRDIYL